MKIKNDTKIKWYKDEKNNTKIIWENKIIQRYNEKIKWYNDVEMKWYKYEKIKIF